MGFHYSNNIDVFVYDDEGKQTDHFTGTHNLFTTRPRPVEATPDGVTIQSGSADWLKQVYVSDSAEGLNALLRRKPLAPEAGPGTSGSSKQVLFCMARGLDRTIEADQTVVAMGDILPATVAGPYILCRELHVSPVEIDAGHPLYPIWASGTRIIM